MSEQSETLKEIKVNPTQPGQYRSGDNFDILRAMVDAYNPQQASQTKATNHDSH